MKLLLENLPPSLEDQSESIGKCLRAMDAVLPLHSVYLFGSRGDARADSDVDFCIVSDVADNQFAASRVNTESLFNVWPRPAFTLLPISTVRLDEKKANGDFFVETLMREGVQLSTED